MGRPTGFDRGGSGDSQKSTDKANSEISRKSNPLHKRQDQRVPDIIRNSKPEKISKIDNHVDARQKKYENSIKEKFNNHISKDGYHSLLKYLETTGKIIRPSLEDLTNPIAKAINKDIIITDIYEMHKYHSQLDELDKQLSTTINQLKKDENEIARRLDTQKNIARRMELNSQTCPEASNPILVEFIKEWGLGEREASQLSKHNEEKNTRSANVDLFSNYPSTKSGLTIPYSLDHFRNNLETLSKKYNTWTNSTKSSLEKVHPRHKELMQKLLDTQNKSSTYIKAGSLFKELSKDHPHTQALQAIEAEISKHAKSYFGEFNNLSTINTHIEKNPRRIDFENAYRYNKESIEKIQNIIDYSHKTWGTVLDYIETAKILRSKDELDSNWNWEVIKPMLRDTWTKINIDIQPGFKQTNSDLERIIEELDNDSHQTDDDLYEEAEKSLNKYKKRVSDLGTKMIRTIAELDSVDITDTRKSMEDFKIYTSNIYKKLVKFAFNVIYESSKKTGEFIHTWEKYSSNIQQIVDEFHSKLNDIIEKLPNKSELRDPLPKIDIQTTLEEINLVLEYISPPKVIRDKCEELLNKINKISDYDTDMIDSHLEAYRDNFNIFEELLNEHAKKVKEAKNTIEIITEKLRPVTITDTDSPTDTLNQYITSFQEETNKFLSSLTYKKSQETKALMRVWKTHSSYIESSANRFSRELDKLISNPNDTKYFERLSGLPEHLDQLRVD